MSSEELRRRVNSVPFEILAVNVADGRQLPVIGRDFILISGSGRVVTVYQRDGTREILDCLLLTGLTLAPEIDPPAE